LKSGTTKTTSSAGPRETSPSRSQESQSAQSMTGVLKDNADTIALVAVGVVVIGAGAWAISKAYNWMTSTSTSGEHEGEEESEKIKELKLKANLKLAEDLEEERRLHFS
jgi:hypothetical protein